MKNNILDKNNINKCTGCSICYAVCPVEAIEIFLTKDGFYEPVVDMKKCIKCGKCYEVCAFDSIDKT